MGKLLYDTRSQELMQNDYKLSKYSKQLLNDAINITEKTNDNIAVAIDLSSNNEGDYSTMIIAKINDGNITMLEQYDETDYMRLDMTPEKTGKSLRDVLNKIQNK